MTPQAQRAAEALRTEYAIGKFSQFCDEPGDFDDAASEDVAAIIDRETNLPALLEQNKRMREALRSVLASASPHPVDNPGMFAVWNNARLALAETEEP